MQELNDKVAYVTGGTKGIGFGIAKALVDAGLKVAISGRKLEDVQQAKEQLGSENVLAVASDVSNFEDETAAISEIVQQFGKLDILIANAGVGMFAPVDELSLEDWNAMIATNLTGAFHTLKAGVDQLKLNQGYYITISSLAGTNFFAGGSGYNASKFGVVGFTQAAMLDLRQYGIKSTTIMPGSVTSHFNGHTPSESDSWKIQPSDIGELIVNLLRMNSNVLPSKIEVRPTQTK